MLGMKYFKAEPTEFARMRVGGKLKKEGEGISGFYMPFKTTIDVVPITSQDQPFGFQDVSKDNQEVVVQGEFGYRISDPKTAMASYNFSIDPRTKQHQTDDPRKLPEHVLQLVRGNARRIIQVTPLEELLLMGDDLANQVMQNLDREVVKSFGVDLSTLYFESIKPKLEIAKALEASYREELLQKADEAIYARRAQAVEAERAIQENEMRTLVEMEEKKKELVELEGANVLQKAEYGAQAAKKALEVYDGVETNMVAAQALLKMGENAGRIGNLTITPEIVAGIMNGVRAEM